MSEDRELTYQSVKQTTYKPYFQMNRPNTSQVTGIKRTSLGARKYLNIAGEHNSAQNLN